MKKHLIFAVYALLLSTLAFAQHGQVQVDSLIKELAGAKEDTNKVKLLNQLSYSFGDINPDKGVLYGQESLTLSEKLGWKKGIATAYKTLGINYLTKAEYPKALDYFLKALKLNEELGDKVSIAANLGNIGIIYSVQENFPRALEYYFKALKIDEDLGEKHKAAVVMGNIGNVYDIQNDYPKAMEYMLKTLAISEELGAKTEIATDDGTIAIIYSQQKNYPKALEYNLKALKIVEELNNRALMTTALGNTGECYLKIAKDNTGTIQASELIPGGKQGCLSKAIEYLGKAIVICKEIGDLNKLQVFTKSLSEAQELSGNYKGALESYKLAMNAKDSVFSTENNIKITNLETKRELELKDKQIEIDKLAVAKKRNERGFFIAGLFLLSIIGVLFINRQRLAQKKLEAEKKNAESELESAAIKLDNFRKSVQEKNVIIEHFTTEIERMKQGEELKTDTELLSQLEHATILTDEQWEDFRQLFEKVHKGFFSSLKQKMPDLTQAEIRFLALSKLKLTSKEMASMLGISTNAIRIYRHRLRRKLDLDKDDMIEELVENI